MPNGLGTQKQNSIKVEAGSVRDGKFMDSLECFRSNENSLRIPKRSINF